VVFAGTPDSRHKTLRLVRAGHVDGRLRIGTVTGPLDSPCDIERLLGYRDVVGQVPERFVVSAHTYTHQAGAAAMDRLLTQCPDLDAGSDDSPTAAVTQPALTTVRQHLDVIGTRMVRLLHGQQPDNVVVPTELVVRGST
jgi:DNA-binding LacI/PurR family transcriptional regulator